jgi:hypothetical protein
MFTGLPFSRRFHKLSTILTCSFYVQEILRGFLDIQEALSLPYSALGWKRCIPRLGESVVRRDCLRRKSRKPILQEIVLHAAVCLSPDRVQIAPYAGIISAHALDLQN